MWIQSERRTTRNWSVKEGNGIIRKGEIRTRDKARNTVGSKDEIKEIEWSKETKVEKEGIRTSHCCSKIFSTPKPVVANRTGTAARFQTRLSCIGIPPSFWAFCARHRWVVSVRRRPPSPRKGYCGSYPWNSKQMSPGFAVDPVVNITTCIFTRKFASTLQPSRQYADRGLPAVHRSKYSSERLTAEVQLAQLETWRAGRSGIRRMVGASDFSPLQNVQASHAAHPASYSVA